MFKVAKNYEAVKRGNFGVVSRSCGGSQPVKCSCPCPCNCNVVNGPRARATKVR